jgi:ComF family protein
MKSFLREVCIDFISMFYPRYCLVCHGGLVKGEDKLCTHCIYHLPKSSYHTNPQNPVFKRLEGRFPLEAASAFLVFRKRGRAQKILHALKYQNQPELGAEIGRVYGSDIAKGNFFREVEIIVPIPLHVARLRKRGYNQSELFGRGLSEVMNVPMVTDAVERKVKTETQTKKNKLLRWKNVEEVFMVVNVNHVAGKHVMLVDDVITTGATIEACAQQLIKAGCKKISVVSIAYASK